jgi:hypothetical protein
MGYSTLLDIVGSIIIGGLLLITLLTTNSSAVQNTYTYGGDVAVQQGLNSLASTMESDFNRIGYLLDPKELITGTPVIISADTSSIQFYSDLYNTGGLCIVNYYLGPTSELSGKDSPNPRDRNIYRVVTSNPPTATMKCPGVTIFRLAYYDTSGTKLSCPVTVTANIAKIQIFLKMESPFPYDGNYVSTYWNNTKYVVINTKNR